MFLRSWTSLLMSSRVCLKNQNSSTQSAKRFQIIVTLPTKMQTCLMETEVRVSQVQTTETKRTTKSKKNQIINSSDFRKKTCSTSAAKTWVSKWEEPTNVPQAKTHWSTMAQCPTWLTKDERTSTSIFSTSRNPAEVLRAITLCLLPTSLHSHWIQTSRRMNSRRSMNFQLEGGNHSALTNWLVSSRRLFKQSKL